MKLFSLFVISATAQKSKGDINLNKDPEDLMNGLVKRYARFLNEEFSAHQRGEIVQENLNNKIQSQAAKHIARYQETNDACGHWPIPGPVQGDDFDVDR